MIALQITDKNDFIQKLLKTPLFHHFLLEEAVIFANATYTIDGHINPDFFTGDDAALERLNGFDCLPFSDLQTACLSAFPAVHMPTAFKFVLKLSPSNQKNTLLSLNSAFSDADINGIYMNFRLQNDILSCTPGINYRTFTMDHSLDGAWDQLVKKFLYKNTIGFEEL